MTEKLSILMQLPGMHDASLPREVLELHRRPRPAQWHGRAQVTAARGWLARLCARVAGLPLVDGDVPVTVTITAAGADAEQWTRAFGSARFRSTLRVVGDVLHEQMGPVRLRFRLEGNAQGISWHPVALDVLRVPMPRAWLCGVTAQESAGGARYHFDVAARLPVAGHLVRYVGWLDVG
jgi:Domain of unknown function (DUF4166)